MPALLEILLLLLAMAYAGAHIGVLAVWGVHLYYVQRGKPGLLADRWSLTDLWLGFHLALALTLVMLVSTAALGAFLIGIFAPHNLRAIEHLFLTIERDSPLVWAFLLPLLLMQNVAFVATAVIYLVGKYGLDIAKLGLLWDWQRIRVGILWGGAAFLITPVVELLSVGILRLVLGPSGFERLMNWEQNTVALEAFLQTLRPGLVVFAFVVMVAVVAPLGEEIFFRGFVYNLLRNRLSDPAGAWISAALFAVLHASVKNFLPILVIGVLLAKLYARTGSLWSCVVMHGTFNFLSAVAMLVFREV